MGGFAWTEDDVRLLLKMRRERYRLQTIAERLGRSVFAVDSKLRAIDDYGPRGLRMGSGLEYVAARDVPAEVLAQQERAYTLKHTSLTAFLCGDPLPGRSALDRKMESA